ncbi:MAG: transposase [Planctomycetaceae bacterium]|nr:transposase [Planctomycetaceae bacterium]
MKIDDLGSGKSYFRKRRRRFDDAAGARSLTFSCYRRYPFLSRDRTRLWFLEALNNARRKYPVDIWAWVIMPEHVHLLVYPREPGRIIGPFQGFVKEQVARQAINWMKGHSPSWLSRITVVEGKTIRRRFWQPGGGYDRNVVDDKVLLAVIEYLHQNPVRRGLVERSHDWEWSSARWYNGEPNCRLEIDRTLPMIDVEP